MRPNVSHVQPVGRQAPSSRMVVAALFTLTVALPSLPPSGLAGSDVVGSRAAQVVASARTQIGTTIRYDSSYIRLSYPNGDLPLDRGVCTDVIIRAFRSVGVDLQREVHQDMEANFSKYPQLWGLKRPDSNIDHRRVPNLMTFLQRRGKSRPVTQSAGDYRPGDVVAWRLGNGLHHIGLLSDRISLPGTPLVIHNIGAGTQEEDILFSFKILGHYQWFDSADETERSPEAPAATRPRDVVPTLHP